MPCLPGGPCGSFQWLEHYNDSKPAPSPAPSPGLPSLPGLPAFVPFFGGGDGHLVGPNWEYPIITIGPITVVDNDFLTITVKFTGTVGHDTGSPFTVNLGASGMAEARRSRSRTTRK